jgi:hypothetical protein
MSYANGPRIVTDGLIFHVDAANKKSYPGTGTTWYDLSGNQQNVTLQNGPSYSSLRYGKFSFDGTNDGGLITSNSEMLSIVCPMTILVWAKQTSTGNYRVIFGQYSAGTNHRLIKMLRIDSSSRVVRYFYGISSGGYSYKQHSIYPTLNQWNFYSVIVSGTVSSAYITLGLNTTFTGASSAGALTSTPDTSTAVRIGRMNSGEFWAGDISVVSVYNKALSTNEVTNIYNANKGRYEL